MPNRRAFDMPEFDSPSAKYPGDSGFPKLPPGPLGFIRCIRIYITPLAAHLSLAVQITLACAASASCQRAMDTKLLISCAASSTLATQIENAAPSDLFISADLDWMDYLQRRNPRPYFEQQGFTFRP